MSSQQKNKSLVQINKIQKDELVEIVKEKDSASVHQKLKKLLKTILIVGQIQFLEAGKVLHYIKENKTFKTEDSSRNVTWGEFCSQPDFPLPGVTAEAKRRKADMLIRVYSTFRKKFKIDPFVLAEIGYTKLHMIATEVEEHPDMIDEWITKSQELTEPDLLREISEGGKTLEELNKCKHANVKTITIYKCEDCGTTSSLKF